MSLQPNLALCNSGWLCYQIRNASSTAMMMMAQPMLERVSHSCALRRQVMVAEPTVGDTINILRGLSERYSGFHGVRIADRWASHCHAYHSLQCCPLTMYACPRVVFVDSSYMPRHHGEGRHIAGRCLYWTSFAETDSLDSTVSMSPVSKLSEFKTTVACLKRFCGW
jgi:hypothetical protein